MVANLKSLMDKIKMFKLASAMDRYNSEKDERMKTAIMKLTHGLNTLIDSAEQCSLKKGNESSDEEPATPITTVSSTLNPKKAMQDMDDDKVH